LVVSTDVSVQLIGLETSLTNYQSTLRNMPEERRSNVQRSHVLSMCLHRILLRPAEHSTIRNRCAVTVLTAQRIQSEGNFACWVCDTQVIADIDTVYCTVRRRPLLP